MNINQGLLTIAKRPVTREMSNAEYGNMKVKIALLARKNADSGNLEYPLADDDQELFYMADHRAIDSLSESSRVIIRFVFTREVSPRQNNIVDYLANQKKGGEKIAISETRDFIAWMHAGKIMIGDCVAIKFKDGAASMATIKNDTGFQPAQLASAVAFAVRTAK